MTDRRIMTDLQCAYLLGRNPALPLGGTGCHAYLEFTCGEPDEQRLAHAWQSLFFDLPALRSAYLPNGMMECRTQLPAAAQLEVVDLRNLTPEEREAALETFRKERSRRICPVEDGEVCGLALIKEEKGQSRLVFDWDLTAGDVPSFLNVLDMLSRRYRDASCVLNASGLSEALDLLEQRYQEEKKTARELFKKEMDCYPVGCPLPAQIDVAEIHESTYHSKDSFLEPDIWKQLQALAGQLRMPMDGVLLYGFCLALGRRVAAPAFLINVPCFLREKAWQDMVGDFSRSVLIPFEKCADRTLKEGLSTARETFEKALTFRALGSTAMAKKLAARDREAWVAPVIFSPVTQQPLVSHDFIETFGPPDYMISQTPQVWLDAQTFLLEGKLWLSMVFPEGLFAPETEQGICDDYAKALRGIAKRGASPEITEEELFAESDERTIQRKNENE